MALIFFIKKLIENLKEKAANKNRLPFFIVDNTDGKDIELKNIIDNFDTQIVLKAYCPTNEGSKAHAATLDFALSKIESDYALVVDPDIHVFLSDWDQYIQHGDG